MNPTLTPMDPHRREAVRALLVAAASAAPVRVPRWRRPVARRLVLGSVGATAVLVTTAVLLVADPAAPPSYATWTAVPRTASGGSASASEDEIEQWASACSELTHTGVGVQGVGARRAEASGRPVLVDRRGAFTFCVDVSAGSGTEKDPLIATSGLSAGDLSRGWAGLTWDGD